MTSVVVNIDWRKETAAFRLFLMEQERAGQTIQSYLTCLALLKEFLSGESVLSKQKLISFKEWLWDRYKPATCNARIAGINAFLRFIGAEDLRLKFFKKQETMTGTAQRYLSREEYRELFRAALEIGKERLALGMEAIASTGARISELRYFTVESIRSGQITIRNKGKIRMILISGILKEKLLAYASREMIRKGSIFVTSSGKPVDRSNFWREMQKLKSKVKIEKDKLFPHNLRHFFACTYYEETKDIAALGDILGHSSLDVTRIYTRKTLDKQIKTLDLLSVLIDSYLRL